MTDFGPFAFMLSYRLVWLRELSHLTGLSVSYGQLVTAMRVESLTDLKELSLLYNGF